MYTNKLTTVEMIMAILGLLVAIVLLPVALVVAFIEAWR